MTTHLDFLPLGGTGEIGMNLNLYGHAGRWLMVDAGVLFERGLGGRTVVSYPDPSFIARRRKDLAALVITHAHQDHIGAVADLWRELQCPVYATPFAAAMLEGPLAEAGLAGKVPIRRIEGQETFGVGPFQLRRIPMTHSTVEMGALLIETPAGRVLHTGDFKLDPDPVVGPVSDEAFLRTLEGVDLCVSDSTNADVPGWTASEGSLMEPLRALIGSCKGRVAVPLFSSNVARIHTLSTLAEELNRDLVFVGRSVESTVGAAKRAGYLQHTPAVVPLHDYGYIPPERVLMVCTGSQGEAQAALSRIASGDHRAAYLDEGDTVIFSARAIPGNELELARLHQLLRRRGVNVVTANDAHVHVSGHPCQDELRALYGMVKPRRVVPVHGTPTKLEAHAKLAEDLGIQACRVQNGDRLRLQSGSVTLVERVHTGRVVREEPDPRSHRGGKGKRGRSGRPHAKGRR